MRTRAAGQAIRIRTLVAATALALAAGPSGPATAASISLVEIQHDLLAEVAVGGQADVTDDLHQSTLLASGEVSASDSVAGVAGSAFASQFTTLTADSFRSFGSANASGVFLTSFETDHFDGSSQLHIRFTVDEEVTFFIDTLITVRESSGGGAASVVMREVGGQNLSFSSRDTVGDEGQILGGVLLPGKTYEIEASASANVVPGEGLSGTAVGGYRINLSISSIIVPEPGSAATAASGLALLAWLCRRTRRGAVR